jgi:O-antigen/teichoic acid export membrane protein
VKFKTIIQNIGANLLITILGLVGSIILARWLGPTQRGVFAAIILIPSILQYVVNIGLSAACVFFTALPAANRTVIWSTVFTFGFLQSIVGIGIGWFATTFYLRDFHTDSLILAHLHLLTIPFGLFGMYAQHILLGASLYKITNFLKCIVPAGYCVGIIILKLLNTLDIQHLVYLQLSVQFLHLILSLVLLYKNILHSLAYQYDGGMAKQMLHYGFKVWLGDISQLANARIDQFLIGFFLNSRDLGIYTIAVSAANFLSIFANAVEYVMLPVVASKTILHEKHQEIISYFNKYWLISILLHICFGISVFFLIPFIFGVQYADSVIICQILIVGSLFINAKNVLGGGIQGMGFPEVISIVEAIGMVISFIFSFLWIKNYGLIGVATAISLAYFSQFLGLIILSQRKGLSYKKLLFTSKNEIIDHLKWLKTFYQKPNNEYPTNGSS